VRADRLLQLLFLLRRHGRLPARRLAELLEVSERTVLRDMEALSAAGVPVYCEQGRGGGCVLMEGYETDLSGLTSEEAQALFSWTTQGAAADLGLGAQLGTALTKLAATVPQPALERADALAAVVVVDRRRWFAAAEEVPSAPPPRTPDASRTPAAVLVPIMPLPPTFISPARGAPSPPKPPMVPMLLPP